MKQPVFTVIAGANGSGKSTLTSGSPDDFSQFPVLDPDAIANTIRSSDLHAVALTAGRRVLERMESYIEAKKSFAVETTLSGKNYLRTMAVAHQRGFQVVLVYIGTTNVEINLARIAARVLVGGHDVPETDVRRRYARSFHHLPSASTLADAVILFDNSTEQGYQLVGLGNVNQFQWMESLPRWAAQLRISLA